MSSIGVSLSGGGIKAFGHCAALQVLESKDIEISAISGTSMGSLVAALVSIGLTTDEIIAQLLSLEKIFIEKMKNISNLGAVKMRDDKLHYGLIDGTIIENILADMFGRYGVVNITDVKIPLAIPSLDLKTGKIVVFNSHNDVFQDIESDYMFDTDITLAKAICASSSLPFFISACDYKGYQLIDGYKIINSPTSLLPKEKKALELRVAFDFSLVKKKNNFKKKKRIENAIHDIGLSNTNKYSICVPLRMIHGLSLGKGDRVIRQSTEYINNEFDFSFFLDTI